MPTVFRFISKLVLFVLVMAVSGVSAVHAQTDPEPALPTEEDELSNSVGEAPGVMRVTPESAEKSARLYQTDEQIVLNSGDGGDGGFGAADYQFLRHWHSQHPDIDDITYWYFYDIEGYDDRFFVEVVGSARVKDNASTRITFFEPFIKSMDPANTRLVRWAPMAFTPIPTESDKITFEVGTTLKGVKSGIKTEIPNISGFLQPSLPDGTSWYSVGWRGNDNGTVGSSFVSYWEGDWWDLAYGTCGAHKPSMTNYEKPWGTCIKNKGHLP